MEAEWVPGRMTLSRDLGEGFGPVTPKIGTLGVIGILSVTCSFPKPQGKPKPRDVMGNYFWRSSQERAGPSS